MNILITGENGYIARHLKQALSDNGYYCVAASLRNGWEDIINLSGYDTVIHCAALVHSNESKPKRFYSVNTELTAALAEKSKREGVRQFIFMSTMAVYGISGNLRGLTVIDRHTPENPVTPYGKSKLLAEYKLKDIANEHFRVYILRLPMVYGTGAPGNYARLCQLVKITPVFPKVFNKRSVISIENLKKYVLTLLRKEEPTDKGNTECIRILCPQDPTPICTSDLAASIAAGWKKTLILSALLGRLILLFPVEPIRKMFGSLIYADEIMDN